MGGCACIEVVNPSVLEGFREYAVSHGVFCRPFGNILYAMVPYVIQEEQLRTVLNVMRSWFTRG